MLAGAKTCLPDFTVPSFGLDPRAGQFLEHVVERRIRAEPGLEFRREISSRPLSTQASTASREMKTEIPPRNSVSY